MIPIYTNKQIEDLVYELDHVEEEGKTIFLTDMGVELTYKEAFEYVIEKLSG